MNFFNNKKILFYGPANDFNINTDLSFFNNYDIVIINNKFIELLQPNLINIKQKNFNIVLLLNGVFTNGNPETIQKYKDQIVLFLVSETCLIRNLLNINIPQSKIISMANNYKKFNFIGCPNMFPKLIMLFIDYNINFTELSITGITFYMDLLDNNLKLKQTYHQDYHNWNTKIPKELNNLSDNEKMGFHLNKIVKLGTDKTNINLPNVYNHFIDENFEFFLKYYKEFHKKIKLDNILENIINKYL